MKREWVTLVLVCAMAASVAWGRTLQGRRKAINLDGKLSEWSGRDMMYPQEQIGEGLPLNSTYTMIYVCNDAESLYVGLELAAPSSIRSNWTHNLYIDTDMDSQTGFDGGWMDGGYDRMVQYGGKGQVFSVYGFTGEVQSAWAWAYLGEIEYMFYGNVIEWKIPRAKLEMGTSREARLEFQVGGPGVEQETWAHKSEALVSTYVFSGPGSP